jgi:O-antigen/teichoic acid export membrane protein
MLLRKDPPAFPTTTLWNRYRHETFKLLIILLPGAALVWLISPWLLEVWLGHPLHQARAILLPMLVYTVLSSSSIVGSALLVRSGRSRRLIISLVVSGAFSVVLAMLFVTWLKLGLAGVVFATIIADTVRCAIWTPREVARMSLIPVGAVSATAAPA